MKLLKKWRDENMDLKFYNINYASDMLNSSSNKREKVIFSKDKLEIDEFIVVECKGNGVFIGRVLEDVTDFVKEDRGDFEDPYDVTQYRYVQKIDLSNWIGEIEKKKRKEKLEQEMKEHFKRIDEKKKYEYYASIDDEFKKIYDEYKEL